VYIQQQEYIEDLNDNKQEFVDTIEKNKFKNFLKIFVVDTVERRSGCNLVKKTLTYIKVFFYIFFIINLIFEGYILNKFFFYFYYNNYCYYCNYDIIIYIIIKIIFIIIIKITMQIK
jgi:hypothetical protein